MEESVDCAFEVLFLFWCCCGDADNVACVRGEWLRSARLPAVAGTVRYTADLRRKIECPVASIKGNPALQVWATQTSLWGP